MASAETIHSLLANAARLLDEAATEIRDAHLLDKSTNIRRIGNALAEIFEIQHELYRHRPDLQPEFLRQPAERVDANRALTLAMSEAVEREQRGDIPGAIAAHREFLERESSEHHRDIAAAEIERLQRLARP